MNVSRAIPYLVDADFAAVKDFYVGVLGMTVWMEDDRFLGLGSPTNPTAQIVAAAPGAEQPRLGIDVGDPAAVDAVHAEALARGLEIVRPLTDEPWGVRRFFLRDPTGAIVSILAHA